MKKNKFPKISDLEVANNKFLIFFDGGDLGMRENVENFNDFLKCQRLFDDAFYEYSTDYKEIYWSIQYTIPDDQQYIKLRKNGNYEKSYPRNKNIYQYTPLFYNFKTKTLYVEPFFFLKGEPSFISSIIDYCKSIKKIEILMTALLEGEFTDKFTKDKTLFTTIIEDYLQKFLGHKKFFGHYLIPNKDQLNGLIELKKTLKHKKIKIIFPDIIDEDKVILKNSGLIS